jgi:hypothetical protein
MAILAYSGSATASKREKCIRQRNLRSEFPGRGEGLHPVKMADIGSYFE